MTEFDTREKVAELVPHKGKMLLLDRIVSCDLPAATIETEVDIHKDSMFFEESFGGVPVWIGFEYMAQSVSSLSGIYGRVQNKKPQVGFILSVSNFCAEEQLFPLDSTVRIWVHQTLRLDMAVTFEGKIFIGDKQIASATINTIEVEDPKKALGV